MKTPNDRTSQQDKTDYIDPLAENRIIETSASPEARNVSVPLDAVNWTSGFWAEHFQQTSTVTVRKLWDLLADSDGGHVLENFRIAAAHKEGEHQGTFWQDAWLYKWIEAASCIYRVTGEQWLDDCMEEGVSLVKAAQREDGYIATQITIPGRDRFQNTDYHEVYSMGHLLTAAVIHRRMTGKENFFEIASRVGDFLCTVLGVTVDPGFAHNPSAIMGLVELYRETKNDKYLDCAKLIVDKRGHNPKRPDESRPKFLGTDAIQDRVPLRQEQEVVGHNVFFTYLFTGATDVYLETGDESLKEALDRLWHDLVTRKISVNGGVSPMGDAHSIRGDRVPEAVGPAYFLPNADSYNETCGQIGNLMWNQRMLLADPQTRYADMVEWEIYNGILPGVDLKGEKWWYRNPLRRHADHVAVGHNNFADRRPPGKRGICCPTNMLRTLAQFQGYVYTVDSEGVWIHQYGASKANLRRQNGDVVEIEQKTDYPWNGRILIKIDTSAPSDVTIRLRIPGWAKKATLKINEHPDHRQLLPGSYVWLKRIWKSGDYIELNLPMPARLLTANPKVEHCRNQVAVARGPILYCLEDCDLPEDVDINQVHIPSNIQLIPESMHDMPFGIMRLRGQFLKSPAIDWNNSLYRTLEPSRMESLAAYLVPYFTWHNREKTAMSVWLPVTNCG